MTRPGVALGVVFVAAIVLGATGVAAASSTAQAATQGTDDDCESADVEAVSLDDIERPVAVPVGESNVKREDATELGEVTNPIPAEGGASAETTAPVETREPRELREYGRDADGESSDTLRRSVEIGEFTGNRLCAHGG